VCLCLCLCLWVGRVRGGGDRHTKWTDINSRDRPGLLQPPPSHWQIASRQEIATEQRLEVGALRRQSGSWTISIPPASGPRPPPPPRPVPGHWSICTATHLHQLHPSSKQLVPLVWEVPGHRQHQAFQQGFVAGQNHKSSSSSLPLSPYEMVSSSPALGQHACTKYVMSCYEHNDMLGANRSRKDGVPAQTTAGRILSWRQLEGCLVLSDKSRKLIAAAEANTDGRWLLVLAGAGQSYCSSISKVADASPSQGQQLLPQHQQDCRAGRAATLNV